MGLAHDYLGIMGELIGIGKRGETHEICDAMDGAFDCCLSHCVSRPRKKASRSGGGFSELNMNPGADY